MGHHLTAATLADDGADTSAEHGRLCSSLWFCVELTTRSQDEIETISSLFNAIYGSCLWVWKKNIMMLNTLFPHAILCNLKSQIWCRKDLKQSLQLCPFNDLTSVLITWINQNSNCGWKLHARGSIQIFLNI